MYTPTDAEREQASAILKGQGGPFASMSLDQFLLRLEEAEDMLAGAAEAVAVSLLLGRVPTQAEYQERNRWAAEAAADRALLNLYTR